MTIAIVGGGFTGLAAAYDLSQAGHRVDLFEAASQFGGLAAGFKEPHWQWSLETYYHHWFASDTAVRTLLSACGLWSKVIYQQPRTVVYYHDHFYPLDSVSSAFKFPGFSPIDTLRFGAATAYLKYLAGWQPLESVTASEWIDRYYGRQVGQVLWHPLLQGKFGPYANQVNMAWLWARIKARTPSLGTYEGGFQECANDLASVLVKLGVNLYLSQSVKTITANKNGVTVTIGRRHHRYDRCLITLAPHLTQMLVPEFPQRYAKKLTSSPYLGAVVVVYSLNQPLSEGGYYWYNLPKSQGFPCLAAVEHTNFVSPSYFGGDHLVYLGDYRLPTDPLLRTTKKQVIDTFTPTLKKINSHFKPSWVKKTWVFRTAFAQPVPFIDHSRRLLPFRSPISSVYLANMSQVYPWDRGTNYAIDLGRRAAKAMLADTN